MLASGSSRQTPVQKQGFLNKLRLRVLSTSRYGAIVQRNDTQLGEIVIVVQHLLVACQMGVSALSRLQATVYVPVTTRAQRFALFSTRASGSFLHALSARWLFGHGASQSRAEQVASNGSIHKSPGSDLFAAAPFCPFSAWAREQSPHGRPMAPAPAPVRRVAMHRSRWSHFRRYMVS